LSGLLLCDPRLLTPFPADASENARPARRRADGRDRSVRTECGRWRQWDQDADETVREGR